MGYVPEDFLYTVLFKKIFFETSTEANKSSLDLLRHMIFPPYNINVHEHLHAAMFSSPVLVACVGKGSSAFVIVFI